MQKWITLVLMFIGTAVFSQGLPCDHAERIPLNVKVPNIFTPNGDGINDLFRADYNYNEFDQYTLRVFSRTGHMLFYAERPAQGWDGRNTSGMECTTGTYFYIIEYATPCETNKLSGVLELKR
jgi:gliding motility-associated-like protein